MTDTVKDIADLSDDEISAMSPEQFAALAGGETASTTDEGASADANTGAATEETNTGATENGADNNNDDATGNENGDEDGGTKDDSAIGAEAGSGAGNTADQAGKAADAAANTDAGKTAATDTAKADGAADQAASADYKAQIDRLLAPFKANGQEMSVKSVDEAIQLMQMGANYNRKMASLKPTLALSRMLANAKLGEAELSFLIDVHNKVPAAINKLVKDSGIDPMDLSAEKADNYKPGNHAVSQTEVELDTVLDEISHSQAYPRTLQVVSQQWDTASKRIVADQPQLIKVINGHMESGVYDLISAEVNRERTFGRLSGLSDLEAYRQVGDAMNAQGKFAHIGGSATPAGQQAAPAVINAPANPKQADDSKRKDAKRAAMPAKGAAPAGQKPDFNPLALSDDEFAKFKPT